MLKNYIKILLKRTHVIQNIFVQINNEDKYFNLCPHHTRVHFEHRTKITVESCVSFHLLNKLLKTFPLFIYACLHLLYGKPSDCCSDV